ncbi:hypothetical protein GCM10010251_65090 [Streptomyces aurantiogriseus]|uniref:Uncharacterized protein n=1 Tax=Streptomyces aurantiogriseus TaxID=66870 RepID=A0A918FI75_9ACTN|nr:hypothetical protein GCM10010251_65090 [Streptomyces aurantiogriseus]
MGEPSAGCAVPRAAVGGSAARPSVSGATAPTLPHPRLRSSRAPCPSGTTARAWVGSKPPEPPRPAAALRRERVVAVRQEPVAQLVTANSDCGSRQPYAQHATGSPHRHDPDPPTHRRRAPHRHDPDPPTNPQAPPGATTRRRQRRRRCSAIAAAVPPATAPTPAAAGMPTFAALRPVR